LGSVPVEQEATISPETRLSGIVHADNPVGVGFLIAAVVEGEYRRLPCVVIVDAM
jgi:hypothetical protein